MYINKYNILSVFYCCFYDMTSKPMKACLMYSHTHIVCVIYTNCRDGLKRLWKGHNQGLVFNPSCYYGCLSCGKIFAFFLLAKFLQFRTTGKGKITKQQFCRWSFVRNSTDMKRLLQREEGEKGTEKCGKGAMSVPSPRSRTSRIKSASSSFKSVALLSLQTQFLSAHNFPGTTHTKGLWRE